MTIHALCSYVVTIHALCSYVVTIYARGVVPPSFTLVSTAPPAGGEQGVSTPAFPGESGVSGCAGWEYVGNIEEFDLLGHEMIQSTEGI